MVKKEKKDKKEKFMSFNSKDFKGFTFRSGPVKKTTKQNSHFWEETIDYSSETSPLENSINSFISNEISNINKNITLQTLKILK